MLENSVKVSSNMKLGGFLNIWLSNYIHLDILNSLIFATLCTRTHIMLISTFAF